MKKKQLLVITNEEDRSSDLLNGREYETTTMWYSADSLRQTEELSGFDVVYFRDPFTMDYNLDLLQKIIKKVRELNPEAYYIDGITTLNDMLIEDKWRQYQLLKTLMPKTELVSDFSEIDFSKQFVKKRISSRARGVVFSNEEVDKSAKPSDYVVQEKLDITEEFRVIAVKGSLLGEAVGKTFKTDAQNVKVTGAFNMTDEMKKFAAQAVAKTPNLDLIGLDIAKLTDGSLMLIETNRSPQFFSFAKFTRINPFEILVDKMLAD